MTEGNIDAIALKVAAQRSWGAGPIIPGEFIKWYAHALLEAVAAEASPVAWVGLLSGCRHIHWGNSKPDFPAISKVHPLFLHPATEAPASKMAPFDDWPEYHSEGMGCGLEDRGITDRYEAMRFGWNEALERVAERLPEFPTPPAAPAIPEGWQLVPAIPTMEMIERMRDQNMCGSMDNNNAYLAAIAAAPKGDAK